VRLLALYGFAQVCWICWYSG